MTDMAVLVPTRSRPHQIPQILQAWDETGAWGVADLCFIIDGDDPAYLEYLRQMTKNLAAQRFIIPTWQPMVMKLNRAAVRAAKTYSVVAFMGDDHLPRTLGWANKLYTHGMTQRPSIAYGPDGFHGIKLPTWWSMSSDIINALGKMVPADVQHLFCDNSIKSLGERSETLTYLEDVIIEHMHPYAGKAQMDAQYERVNRPQQYLRDQVKMSEWLTGQMQQDVAAVQALRG